MSFEKDLMSTSLSIKRERPKSDSNHSLIDYASWVDRIEPQKGKKEMRVERTGGKRELKERVHTQGSVQWVSHKLFHLDFNYSD